MTPCSDLAFHVVASSPTAKVTHALAKSVDVMTIPGQTRLSTLHMTLATVPSRKLCVAACCGSATRLTLRAGTDLLPVWAVSPQVVYSVS